jgi:hypothetical protein
MFELQVEQMLKPMGRWQTMLEIQGRILVAVIGRLVTLTVSLEVWLEWMVTETRLRQPTFCASGLRQV